MTETETDTDIEAERQIVRKRSYCTTLTVEFIERGRQIEIDRGC